MHREPFITWMNPASFEPPARNSSTSSESVNETSPSKQLAVSSHQEPCSGRSLLARASASDAKRANASARPSSVTPAVVPR